jgi:hypothetical protein
LFEEAQAKILGDYAAKLALKDAQPTEKSVVEENERISTSMSHFSQPHDYRDSSHKDLIPRHSHTDPLIAFYTSVVALRVTSAPLRNIRPREVAMYDVHGHDGRNLFTCYLDAIWRAKQPESLEFIVIVLKGGAKSVALMLLENVDRVCYRANWSWKLSQHLTIQE